MKIFYCFLFVIFFTSDLCAQSLEKKIVNAAGSNYTGKDFSIKISVGEPVVGMISYHGDIHLSQGFLSGVKAPEKDSSYTVYSYSLYPNPTFDYIVIEGDLTLIKQVNLYNSSGDLVSVQSLQGATVSISNLALGSYIVQLIGKQNEILGVFKIIKL